MIWIVAAQTVLILLLLALQLRSHLLLDKVCHDTRTLGAITAELRDKVRWVIDQDLFRKK